MHHFKFFDHISKKKRETDVALLFKTKDLVTLLRPEEFKEIESFLAYVKVLNSKTFDSTKYSEQTLVIIETDLNEVSTIDYIFNNSKHFKRIILIERTSTSQGYTVGVLDLCPHFSLLTKDLAKFLYVLHQFKMTDTPVVFISSHVCYASEDKKIKVVNGNHNSVPILKSIHSRMIAMFKHGIGNKFTFNDFGRGDVLKSVESKINKATLNDRSIPTISIGFGTQDCTRYSSNRMTLAGNNKPYISNGGLTIDQSKEFFMLVTEVLEEDLGSDAFKVDDLPEINAKLRKHLHQEFAQQLTQRTLQSDDVTNFRIEGSTGIVGQRVAIHCDSENSKVIQMNNAIGLTTNIPMSLLTSSSEAQGKTKFINLHKVLLERGYDPSGSFPFSNILYSKNPIDVQVEKLVKLDTIKRKNRFNDIMIWALTERINDAVDYRGTILDCDKDFCALFEEKLQDQGFQFSNEGKGELLNKPFLALVAAYDKMGYWSIIFDFWNSLVANVIPKANIFHVVQFSLYVGGVCNGTAVPWRLMEEIMKDPTASKKRLSEQFNGNLFEMLKATDEDVAEFQLQEYLASNKSGKSKVQRSRGSCNHQRYQYQKSSQDISAHDTIVSIIVNAINDAYFSSSSKKLRSPGKQSVNEDGGKKKRRNVSKVVEPYEYVVETIEKSVKGVGSLTSQFVMNCICGCGGVPLRSYNEASVPDKWTGSTGPVQLLKRALNLPDNVTTINNDMHDEESEMDKEQTIQMKEIMKKTPSQYYRSLYEDLKTVFKGGQITMNLLENIGCEVWRSFTNTCDRTFDLSKEQYDSMPVSIIKKSVDRHESLKKDLYFHITHRNKPQNLFSIEMGRAGTLDTNPCMFIKLPENKKLIRFTNWKGSAEAKNMVWWNKKSDTCKFTKSVHLVFNDQYKDIFLHSTIKSENSSGTVTHSGRQVRAPNYFAKRSSDQFLDDDNDSDYVEF